MSNYDPFHLYSRSQKSTHKGQVLRKKFYPYLGSTFTDETIQRVIKSLEERGYRIFPPGRPFPSKPDFIFRNLIYTLDTGVIDLLSPNQYYDLPFSLLWDAIFPSFSDILNPPLNRVSDFQILVNIISINLFGTFSYTSSGAAQFNFYFEDPSSVLLIPDTSYIMVNSDVNLISLQSYSETQYLESYGLVYKPGLGSEAISAKSKLENKLESLNSSLLYSYLNTEKSIIPFLASQDYTSINFPLYNVAFGGSAANGSAHIGSSSVTVQVYLQYYLSS